MRILAVKSPIRGRPDRDASSPGLLVQVRASIKHVVEDQIPARVEVEEQIHFPLVGRRQVPLSDCLRSPADRFSTSYRGGGNIVVERALDGPANVGRSGYGHPRYSPRLPFGGRRHFLRSGTLVPSCS